MAARNTRKKSPSRKSSKKTTRKTSQKATAKPPTGTPTLSFESLRDSMNIDGLRQGLVSVQKRSLEAQKRAVDLGLDAMMNMERRQRDAVLNVLEESKRVPGEVREMAAAWADFRLARQEAYKKALDQSYSLAHRYLDGVAEA